jgi:ATP-dependent Clp protease protease subunit
MKGFSMSYQVPAVIEKNGQSERVFDLFSRLLRDRIVYLGTQVDDDSARILICQLLFLEAEKPGVPIELYINSPGGSVIAGLSIYDTMQVISSPVHTTCIGMAASMGAFLLAGGHPGCRKILPNSEVMIHQIAGGAEGKGTDVEIQYRHMMKLKERLTNILAENVGKSYQQVWDDCERDKWLTSEEALAYGLVDEIVGSTREAKRLRVIEAEAHK